MCPHDPNSDLLIVFPDVALIPFVVNDSSEIAPIFLQFLYSYKIISKLQVLCINLPQADKLGQVKKILELYLPGNRLRFQH